MSLVIEWALVQWSSVPVPPIQVMSCLIPGVKLLLGDWLIFLDTKSMDSLANSTW
jgi:hypothetical protein